LEKACAVSRFAEEDKGDWYIRRIEVEVKNIYMGQMAVTDSDDSGV